MRYEQLIKLIDLFRPRFIVEIGTHRGTRAVQMCQAALRYRNDVHYVGYDLFDETTPAIDAEELNIKAMKADRLSAKAGLSTLKKHAPNFTFELVPGNTRETLHGKTIMADFAFIDGGHSVETIRGDYEALKTSKIIVFDDYYTDGPDIEKFGCNKVVENFRHYVLPHRNKVDGGGSVQMVLRI